MRSFRLQILTSCHYKAMFHKVKVNSNGKPTGKGKVGLWGLGFSLLPEHGQSWPLSVTVWWPEPMTGPLRHRSMQLAIGTEGVFRWIQRVQYSAQIYICWKWTKVYIKGLIQKDLEKRIHFCIYQLRPGHSLIFVEHLLYSWQCVNIFIFIIVELWILYWH